MRPLVVTLPGYQGSTAMHWQTLWEQKHPFFLRAEQRDWDHPVAEEWADQLEKTLQQCEEPVILVTHSIGCLVLAHWANRPHTPIKSALIVAPPDPNASAFPSDAQGFEQTPMIPFEFPSIILASANDPYASLEYSHHLAQAWGSRFVNLGALGHINLQSNLGAWEEGYAYLESLLSFPKA